jgi:outer membrane immunogenic protein
LGDDVNKLTALGVAFAIVAVSAPAFAADMALKAPPVVVPVWSWTGWYAGLNLGGSFGNASDSVTFAGVPIATAGSQRLDGVIGGGQIGYNWQSGTWLFGLEADIQGSSERNNDPALASFFFNLPQLAPPTNGILGVNEKLGWFGTVRSRLGVLANPNWLLYATGGLAYGGVQTTETFSSVAAAGTAVSSNSFSSTRAGWTLGGGVEAVLGNNWTAKVEYLYIDLGSFSSLWTVPGALPVFSPVGFSSHVTDNIVRAGVNYHFH